MFPAPAAASSSSVGMLVVALWLGCVQGVYVPCMVGLPVFTSKQPNASIIMDARASRPISRSRYLVVFATIATWFTGSIKPAPLTGKKYIAGMIFFPLTHTIESECNITAVTHLNQPFASDRNPVIADLQAYPHYPCTPYWQWQSSHHKAHDIFQLYQ